MAPTAVQRCQTTQAIRPCLTGAHTLTAVDQTQLGVYLSSFCIEAVCDSHIAYLRLCSLCRNEIDQIFEIGPNGACHIRYFQNTLLFLLSSPSFQARLSTTRHSLIRRNTKWCVAARERLLRNVCALYRRTFELPGLRLVHGAELQRVHGGCIQKLHDRLDAQGCSAFVGVQVMLC